jgi:hypothetical protein
MKVPAPIISSAVLALLPQATASNTNRYHISEVGLIPLPWPQFLFCFSLKQNALLKHHLSLRPTDSASMNVA